MKKTWYTVKDGKIDRVQIMRDDEKPLPEDKDWKLSPTNNELHEETFLERYDENMRYLTDEEWLRKQSRKDLRGRWYSKDKIGETMLIHMIEETVDETEWTQTAPLENEPHQKFDKAKNKWVIDSEKKERAEKEGKIAAKKSEIATIEQKRIRPAFAMIDGTADDEDVRRNEEYKDKILELRAEIQELEKSA
jgi:hypothetical protein